MNLFTSLDVSASGLTAQRHRMNLIAGNIANINTTKTPDGGPYQRKDTILAPKPTDQASFEEILRAYGTNPVNKVEVIGIFTDPRPASVVYDPAHPDADENGLVALPNINLMEEMGNLLTTLRAYEANLTVINASKDMIKSALKL